MAKILFGDDFVEQNNVITSLINANSPMTYDATMLGAAKIYARKSGHGDFAFYPGGRHVAGHGRRDRHPDPGRSAGGHGLCAASPPGRTGYVWHFSGHFHAVRRTHVRHAGAMPDPVRRRGSCAPARVRFAAAADFAHPRSRMPRRPTNPPTRCRPPLAGVNFMLHTAGWLEGGLTMGYEKFIMDADQATMIGVSSWRGPVRRRPGHGCHPRGRARCAFPRLQHTPRPTSRRPSTVPTSPTTTVSNNGRRTVSGPGPRANKIWKSMLRDVCHPPELVLLLMKC